MNIFTDILFLFVYILTLLYLELPNVMTNNYPIHKLYLFIGVFVYYFVVQIIKKIKNKCNIDLYTLLEDALMISLFCVVGYSLYVDFKYWDYTKDFIAIPNQESFEETFKGYSVVTLVIVGFVTLIQLSKVLFKGTITECDNHESKNLLGIIKF